MGIWEISDDVARKQQLADEERRKSFKEKAIKLHEDELSRDQGLQYYKVAMDIVKEYDLYNVMEDFYQISKTKMWNGFKIEKKSYDFSKKQVISRKDPLRMTDYVVYEMSKKLEDGSVIVVYSSTLNGDLLFDFKNGEWLQKFCTNVEKRKKAQDKKILRQKEIAILKEQEEQERQKKELLQKEEERQKRINRFRSLE